MFWLIQSLPLVFCLGSGNTVSQSRSTPMVVNGVVGESVTLPLDFPEEDIKVVVWLRNTTVITIHMPPGSTKILNPNFKCKEELNFTQSCSLHFCNLTKADSGPYQAQINSNTFFHYVLRVFERLHNLQVSHHVHLSGNGLCEINLTCSVENPNEAVSFGWQVSETTSLSEPNLTVFWDPENSSDESYMCIAENPVSNLSCPVSAKSLCKDILTKENLYWNDLLWIIICGILIIIIVLILACRKRTGRARLGTTASLGRENALGKTQSWGRSPRVLLLMMPFMFTAETSEDIELASISPGSTVYAQVTHPYREMEILTHIKSSDSVTIYSTINHSKQNKPTSPRATAL
ncbi:SLAM family member 6 [Fukomys damarensis]|uniref:SLAM family member 6 n=1 Tax=Fukomys damarensis TaxID=885580 RepID=UPI0008FF3A80|nr:SLAM family member 6 [Fukomys damarensis]